MDGAGKVPTHPCLSARLAAPPERGLCDHVPKAAAVLGAALREAGRVRLPGSRTARGALGAAQGLTRLPGLSCSPPAAPTYPPACKPGTTFRRSILWSRVRRRARCAREANSRRQSRGELAPPRARGPAPSGLCRARGRQASPHARSPAPGIPPGGRAGALRGRVCAGDGSAQPCRPRSASRPARPRGPDWSRLRTPPLSRPVPPGCYWGAREEGTGRGRAEARTRL